MLSGNLSRLSGVPFSTTSGSCLSKEGCNARSAKKLAGKSAVSGLTGVAQLTSGACPGEVTNGRVLSSLWLKLMPDDDELRR